jgi:hypothetical protein
MGASASSVPRGKPPLYGVSLEDLYATHAGVFPPLLRCAQYLEGRLSAADVGSVLDPVSLASLAPLERYLEAEIQDPNLASLASFTPGVVFSFVRRFFESLPEPAIPRERYQQLLNAMDHIEEVSPAASVKADFFDQLFFVQALVVTMPRAHFVVLNCVLGALKRLADSGVLDAKRSALIFASSFMRPPRSSKGLRKLEDKMRNALQEEVLTFLIEHHDPIFRQNPVRELNILFHADAQMRADLVDRESKLERARCKEIGIKNRLAELQFKKRILVRHFIAWRAQTRSERVQRRPAEKLAELTHRLQEERLARHALERHIEDVAEQRAIATLDRALSHEPGPTSWMEPASPNSIYSAPPARRSVPSSRGDLPLRPNSASGVALMNRA